MADDSERRDVARGGWSGDRIRAAILSDTPLIRDFINLDEQIQPNGFDLTLATVSRFTGTGLLTGDSSRRRLPDLETITLPERDAIELAPGPYQIGFNESVHMPLDAMALGRARSSLNRSGVTIHTAVWDAGYEGRSTALLSVLNPAGFRLGRDARVLQLVFWDLAEAAGSGYTGAYQGEGVRLGTAERP